MTDDDDENVNCEERGSLDNVRSKTLELRPLQEMLSKEDLQKLDPRPFIISKVFGS